MINNGWDSATAAAFYALLKESHEVSVEVHLLNMQQQFMGDISSSLIGGQFDMDATADITRSIKLLMLDPENRLGLDNRQSNQGMNFYTRMIRVHYTMMPIDNPAIRYTFPLFTGPITDVDRDGPVLDITCQGKEVMASEGILRDISFPAHWPRTYALLHFLREILGEDYVAFDDARNEYILGQAWAVEAGTNLWGEFKNMMAGIGLHLYYDAWGSARLRHMPQIQVMGFDTTTMTSEAEVTFDIDNMANVVRVSGGTPEGLEGRFVAEAHPNPTHPLSPQNLARKPGVPRYIPEFINDTSLVTQEEVTRRAEGALFYRLVQAIDVSFTAVVIPHLEEEDIVAVGSSRFWGWTRISKITIPLVGDGDMSVGFLSSSSLGWAQAQGGHKFKLVEFPTKPVPKKGKKPKRPKKGSGVGMGAKAYGPKKVNKNSKKKPKGKKGRGK